MSTLSDSSQESSLKNKLLLEKEKDRVTKLEKQQLLTNLERVLRERDHERFLAIIGNKSLQSPGSDAKSPTSDLHLDPYLNVILSPRSNLVPNLGVILGSNSVSNLGSNIVSNLGPNFESSLSPEISSNLTSGIESNSVPLLVSKWDSKGTPMVDENEPRDGLNEKETFLEENAGEVVKEIDTIKPQKGSKLDIKVVPSQNPKRESVHVKKWEDDKGSERGRGRKMDRGRNGEKERGSREGERDTTRERERKSESGLKSENTTESKKGKGGDRGRERKKEAENEIESQKEIVGLKAGAVLPKGREATPLHKSTSKNKGNLSLSKDSQGVSHSRSFLKKWTDRNRPREPVLGKKSSGKGLINLVKNLSKKSKKVDKRHTIHNNSASSSKQTTLTLLPRAMSESSANRVKYRDGGGEEEEDGLGRPYSRSVSNKLSRNSFYGEPEGETLSDSRRSVSESLADSAFQDALAESRRFIQSFCKQKALNSPKSRDGEDSDKCISSPGPDSPTITFAEKRRSDLSVAEELIGQLRGGDGNSVNMVISALRKLIILPGHRKEDGKESGEEGEYSNEGEDKNQSIEPLSPANGRRLKNGKEENVNVDPTSLLIVYKVIELLQDQGERVEARLKAATLVLYLAKLDNLGGVLGRAGSIPPLIDLLSHSAPSAPNSPPHPKLAHCNTNVRNAMVTLGLLSEDGEEDEGETPEIMSPQMSYNLGTSSFRSLVEHSHELGIGGGNENDNLVSSEYRRLRIPAYLGSVSTPFLLRDGPRGSGRGGEEGPSPPESITLPEIEPQFSLEELSRPHRSPVRALYYLALHKSNKSVIVKAGAIKILISILDQDLKSGLVTDALRLLSSLAMIPRGREEMAELEAISLLSEAVENGTDLGTEFAIATLLHMGGAKAEWRQLMVDEGLLPILQTMQLKAKTMRARAKAKLLYGHLRQRPKGYEIGVKKENKI